MPFRCPSCRTASMEPTTLEPELPVDRCSTCLGAWITSARYFAYLAAISPGPRTLEPTVEAATDSPAVKICPTCLKFMRYYPVGHGLPFGIDKCNTCGGVWLNAGEWEALKAGGLERQVHAISADTWQHEIAHERQAAVQRAMLIKRIGAPDLAEIDRVAAWISGHAHRAELLAHLQQQVRE